MATFSIDFDLKVICDCGHLSDTVEDTERGHLGPIDLLIVKPCEHCMEQAREEGRKEGGDGNS